MHLVGFEVAEKCQNLLDSIKNNLNASHVSFPFRAARPESSVDDLEASLSDATVAILTWKRPERPNGRVSSYRIKMFYQDYAGRPHQREISVPGDMTSISLPNLEVYTRYRLAANIKHQQTQNEIASTAKDR